MTRSSWSRQRRVVAKAEWTKDEANPRFVVTSLTRAECKARYLYEKVYCARGDMENRIKECQLDLYAVRTSTATMRANQLRLWFAMAYVLLCALRRIARSSRRRCWLGLGQCPHRATSLPATSPSAVWSASSLHW
jgi:Transposase DDE domain group 1